jgi:NADPH:quinone reductase-like Zn-dependent oxidoreductase
MKLFKLKPGSGLESLNQLESSVPEIEPGKILLKMLSWSLNYRDLLVASGQYGLGLPSPLVPISDGVGEIIESNAELNGFKIGQRVALSFFPDWKDSLITAAKTKSSLGGTTHGLLAEYVTCKPSEIISVPIFLTNEEAATLPCAALTAWNALFETTINLPEKKVLTIGSGGVSIFALQFAKSAGYKVIAISRNMHHLNKLKELGLDEGIESSNNPKWGDAIRKSAFGEVDHAIELGGASTLPQTIRATRVGGEISLIGVLGGTETEFNPLPIVMKSIRLQGIFVGSMAMFNKMNNTIEQKKIKPVIDSVFKFDDARKAFEHMRKGNHFGKICISI